MVNSGKSKALKELNRWQIWLIIAANAVIFYGASQWDAIAVSGLRGAITGATNLLPVGLAVVVATVANGLLSAELKARLVFLRWNQALPGHRAFSVHAKKDPRIDFVRLQRALGNKLPADPEAENKAWYRLYLEVQNMPSVLQVHRDFLLLRDYVGLAALFLIAFGGAAFFVVATWKVFAFYVGFLILQFFVVRHAAATYGIRFVCTVLAQKAAKPTR
jgi:hypothetical protein